LPQRSAGERGARAVPSSSAGCGWERGQCEDRACCGPADPASGSGSGRGGGWLQWRVGVLLRRSLGAGRSSSESAVTSGFALARASEMRVNEASLIGRGRAVRFLQHWPFDSPCESEDGD